MQIKLTFSDRQSGIYQILNLINKKFYIGSAVDFYERYHSHLHYLNSNNHHNEHLQRAYNKYGADAFEFQVLEYCEKDQLRLKEQAWIDWTRACEVGYNIRKDATSNSGLKFSEEHRVKMSVWQIGKRLSEETKEKISNKLKGRIITDEIRNNMANGHKKFEKWPHIQGCYCKCNECQEKKAEYMRNRRAK